MGHPQLLDRHLNDKLLYSTAQLKLYTRVLARLTRVKLQKLACARTVACNFGVRTWASEHMRHTRNARHKLALGLPHYTCRVTRHTRNARHELVLGLPHYTCRVTTGTVAVGNEMQLFCS